MKYELGQLVTVTTEDSIWMVTKLDRDNLSYEIENQDGETFGAMDHNLEILPQTEFINAVQHGKLNSSRFIKSFLNPTNIRTNLL